MSQLNPVVTRIRSTRGWSAINLAELWQYREVIYFLAWRDVKVRYKQTVFGASWAILQPLITMVVFTVVFGHVAKIPSDGIPYPIFSYTALVPWTFFANSVNRGSNSLVGGGSMLRQIYFPRLSMPLSAALGNLLDFLLAFAVLVIMMAYYHIVPTWNVVWLPALLVLVFLTAMGVSLVLTAMNVQFRDVRQATPFLIQIWMFATPVVYPLSVIQNPVFQAIYALNPMVAVVEGFRWALLGVGAGPGPWIFVSISVAIASLVGGAYYFKRMERTFADVV